MSATTADATTATDAPYDPWQAADNPVIRNKTYFGHCAIRSEPVVLAKGSQPIHFDPNQHSVDDRRTRVIVSIQPLPGSRYMDLIERNMLVESNEWTKIAHPSIRALGITPRDLQGLYVRCEMVPTRDYIKRDGTPGVATTPKFVAVYKTEQECRVAQEALFGRPQEAGYSNGSAESAPVVAPPTAPPAGMSPEAQRTLLNALWSASQKSTAQLAVLLSATPSLRHLTLDSEEVKAVTGEF